MKSALLAVIILVLNNQIGNANDIYINQVGNNTDIDISQDGQNNRIRSLNTTSGDAVLNGNNKTVALSQTELLHCF